MYYTYVLQSHQDGKFYTGFTNDLAHDYFGIDIEAVWDTIKNNITPFKKHILPKLSDFILHSVVAAGFSLRFSSLDGFT